MATIKTNKTTTYDLTGLTEREATILCALLGNVSMDLDTEIGCDTYALFCQLNDAIEERTESFSDFFKIDGQDIVVKHGAGE